MWNLTYDINELIYKTETDSKTENKLLATKGESEVKVFVAQSCPTLCDPMDCSPPGKRRK